jgi:CubicO group peptidase (beta-lactamase class C family)
MLAALVLAPWLAPLPAHADPLGSDRVAGALGKRLDARLTRFAEYGFSGTVLVARQGRIVLLKGYGLADAERGVRNTAATRFEMNSMTKMFTGVAALQLAARGRLRLDDPVARYFDGFPGAKQAATIQHLATHTSGLVLKGASLSGDSREAFVRDVARAPIESPPGERYRYTNAGFSLLAAAVEVASGETYEQYLRRHVFAPAGMDTAVFRNEVPAGDPRFAHGYVGTPAARQPGPPNPYVWGTVGAGGVWCTVGDMYRWLQALEGGRVLPDAQRQILNRPPAPPAEEAFGWHVESVDGRVRISKGGGSDDFASQMLYYPRDRVVVIWASNDLRQRWRRTLNAALPGIVFGKGDAAPPPRVAALPATTLQARAGRYRAEGDALELLAGPGYLYAAANTLGVPTSVMFFPQDDALRFTAFDPTDGSRVRLSFGQGDDRPVTIELADGRRVTAHR